MKTIFEKIRWIIAIAVVVLPCLCASGRMGWDPQMYFFTGEALPFSRVAWHVRQLSEPYGSYDTTYIPRLPLSCKCSVFGDTMLVYANADYLFDSIMQPYDSIIDLKRAQNEYVFPEYRGLTQEMWECPYWDKIPTFLVLFPGRALDGCEYQHDYWYWVYDTDTISYIADSYGVGQIEPIGCSIQHRGRLHPIDIGDPIDSVALRFNIPMEMTRNVSEWLFVGALKPCKQYPWIAVSEMDEHVVNISVKNGRIWKMELSYDIERFADCRYVKDGDWEYITNQIYRVHPPEMPDSYYPME